MSEIINIGGLSAAPGQRVHGFISIGNGEFSLRNNCRGENQVKQLSLQKFGILARRIWEYRVQ